MIENPNQVQFNESILDEFNFEIEKLEKGLNIPPKEQSEEVKKLQQDLAAGVLGAAIKNLLS